MLASAACCSMQFRTLSASSRASLPSLPLTRGRLLVQTGFYRMPPIQPVGGLAAELSVSERQFVELGRCDPLNQSCVATGKMDGKVFIGLKIPEFSYPLRAHPAGGQIGDGAVFNSSLGVGDVHFVGKDGKSTARTSRQGELTIQRTRSRSWIMRSRTTSTSRLLGLKTSRR